jgi:hypothetical protein
MIHKILRFISHSIAILALAASVVLLINDMAFDRLPHLPAPIISSAPLLLIGVSFLLLQPLLRPRRAELLKNVLLSATFLLWGAVQLMPQNALAARLGDLVIALYVLDLAWMTLGTTFPREKLKSAQEISTGAE